MHEHRTPTRPGPHPTHRRRSRLLLHAVALGGAISAMALGLGPGQARATPAIASSDECADVEVVFARGTFEAPGIGQVGQLFADAVRSRLDGRTVDVYGVDYPASLDFGRAADGVADATGHVMDTVAACPDTRIVLGGYSQGAAVGAYTTTDVLPAGYVMPLNISGPMPAEVADHVAAVALFGKPSPSMLSLLNRDAPPIAIGSAYAPRTIDLMTLVERIAGGSIGALLAGGRCIHIGSELRRVE